METAGFLQKDSIATQLIKIVFALYCVVAVIVTATQIVLEYSHTKTQIREELTINKEIFEPVLSIGLWNLDDEQLQNTLNGMLAIPIVTGVKIEQNGELFKAVGIVQSKGQMIEHYNDKGQVVNLDPQNGKEIFSYGFDVNYVFRDEARIVGRATLYSDSSAIIDRVEMGIILLIINSVLKTIALWVLFFYVGRRVLLRPLGNLIQAITKVDFKTLGHFKVDLQTERQNELTIIQDSFGQMVNELAQSKDKIMHLNDNLENTVEKRTQDLKTAKEDAELANKAKSVFMARINHELRTPLNAILGCSQILSQQLNDPLFDKQKSLVTHTIDAGEHLLMLFEDIMEIVVNNETDITIVMKNFPLDGLLRSSSAMVIAQAEEKNITVNTEATDLQVLADASRLKQVLLNLLTNAIKYNHVDGSIFISAVEYRDEWLQIIVKDTGIGIAEADKEEIFEPLCRLPYAEEKCIDGAGIGLSIAKNLTEKMNGNIAVQSEPGVGSEFIVTLPKAKADADTPPNQYNLI